MQRLQRLKVRVYEDGSEENKKRQLIFREIKLAMSCFIVVIRFYVRLVPLFPTFSLLMRMNLNVHVWWTPYVPSFNLSPSMNSGIFFWRRKVLRNQAIKIMKNPLT